VIGVSSVVFIISTSCPSVSITPLFRFKASSIAAQPPPKNITVPNTLDAGVRYGVSALKSVVGSIKGKSRKNPFTTKTADPIVKENPTIQLISLTGNLVHILLNGINGFE
jgi:hypothetical protein